MAQLKSHLGLLSYYSKFLPNLSTVVAPLNKLQHRSQPWQWTDKEEAAFTASKQLIALSQVLVHFDPNLEVILSCDALAYGIEAVLSHRLPNGSERPVAFASHTLSPAETRYSQIEKEGLVCVFGVKRLHHYLVGRRLLLCTDHKPLMSLFHEQKAIPNCTSQQPAMHGNADAMSRLPLPSGGELEPPVPAETILLMEQLDRSPITSLQIRQWTRRDPLLSRVIRHVQDGWPEHCTAEELRPFASRSTRVVCA